MGTSASRGGVVVSGREAEVFDLVGDHLTHAEIGERLFISTRTVESHVASLRRKLGMIDHRSLVRMAVKFGSLPPVTALPHEASSFVGRQAELEEVAAAVASSRLVSVVGPGGIGKTRLAMRAASDLSEVNSIDPIWVDLATVVAPGQAIQALVAALGVLEPGQRTYEQVAIDLLRQRTALLVLDNCEHVLDAVATMVEQILAACATVTVLLTSRIRLAVPHEHVVHLGGLPAGSTDNPGAAVDLFMERAAAGGAVIDAAERSRVVDACQALDGMPLAIELAAARVASLGLDGVETGLDNHRRLLVGGARVQARHRSVSDTVEWSYRLLTRLDQNVLSRVSVFRRTFSPADAGVVAAYAGVPERDIAGALGRLAQHSLIEPTATATRVRYRTLEAVRQFGIEQLSADDDRTAQERHLKWCTRRVGDLDRVEHELGWPAEVDEIADEVRATLASIDNTRETRAAHDLARRLADLLFDRGRTTDAQNMFEYAASLADSEAVEAADLTLAASVAMCRVVGPDALRLEKLARDKALAGGDVDLAVRCLASSARLIARFQGMFDDPPPLDRAHRLLEEAKEYGARSPIAEFTIAATEATLDPNRDLDKLEEFASRALGSGELKLASVLLEEIALRHTEDQHLVQAL
ncbi:MAG: LuxR C-terminal-related transcriptional regulator, partial [Acidimicrobiia bacterium]